jgi:hypothetical protein
VTLSKIYRAKAAALAEQAKTASAPRFKRRCEKMALAYERLAGKIPDQTLGKEKPIRAGPSMDWLKIKNPETPPPLAL